MALGGLLGYHPRLKEARRLVAELVGAEEEDIGIVDNASAGVNAVLRHMHPPLRRGDKVLYLSTE
jgi:selenocysteine lyase/cysteine desulfurase